MSSSRTHHITSQHNTAQGYALSKADRPSPQQNTAMFDTVTLAIIGLFLLSSYFGHRLLHRVIRTPAQYYRPEAVEERSGAGKVM
tara:strand:+ start:35048 stop:35302 length:255 start_codon:yes stop_codon:yes gene_type:complete